MIYRYPLLGRCLYCIRVFVVWFGCVGILFSHWLVYGSNKSGVIRPGDHVGLLDNNADGAEGRIPLCIPRLLSTENAYMSWQFGMLDENDGTLRCTN